MVMKKNDRSHSLLILIIVLLCVLSIWFAFRPLRGEISFRQMNEKGLLPLLIEVTLPINIYSEDFTTIAPRHSTSTGQ
jgi:hypothetical protein